MTTKFKNKDLYGTPANAIARERKLGTVVDLADGMEMSEEAAKRVMKAKKQAGWNVEKAAQQAGCELFGNGLVVRIGAHKSYQAKTAEEGDVMTAEEFGVPPGKPALYLILGSMEHDLGIEESGDLSETLICAVKVKVESTTQARARTMARRTLRTAQIEYDALVARSYDDARITNADIRAALGKLESAKNQVASP